MDVDEVEVDTVDEPVEEDCWAVGDELEEEDDDTVEVVEVEAIELDVDCLAVVETTEELAGYK